MDFFGTILQVIFCSILVLAFGMWAMNNPGWVLFITGWAAAAIAIYKVPRDKDDSPIWR